MAYVVALIMLAVCGLTALTMAKAIGSLDESR